MTTCLQLLSTKMQFWVSAPFLLEDCSPALTKRVSTSDKTQSALKTSFSLITSSDLIIRLRYRASRMGANGQRENLKKPITPNERGLRRRKRPNDRNERGGCVRCLVIPHIYLTFGTISSLGTITKSPSA